MSRTKFLLLLACAVFKKCVFAKDKRSGVDWPFEYVIATFPEDVNPTNPFVEQCTAELEEHDTLSWYQIKKSRPTLLNMVQNLEKLSNMTVTLHKSLQDSDRDSVVFCLQEPPKKIVKLFTFRIDKTEIPPIEPAVVNIEPDAKLIYFDTVGTLRLKCYGTKPVDGRKLTWYLETYSESTETDKDLTTVVTQIEIPEHQNYDSNKNENVLELFLDSDYNLKRLFCAEDFSRTIRHGDGRDRVIRFGQRGKSETVTLIMLHSPSTRITPMPSKSYVFATVVMLAFLIIFILSTTLTIVVLKYKRKVAEFERMERQRMRQPLETPNENVYETVYSHGAGLKRKAFEAKQRHNIN